MKIEDIEQRTREEFEARKITPSESAWDEIAGRLASVQKPKRHRAVGYAAAIFIALLGVATLMLLNTEKDLDTPVVVEVPVNKETVPVDGLSNPPVDSGEMKPPVRKAVVGVSSEKDHRRLEEHKSDAAMVKSGIQQTKALQEGAPNELKAAVVLGPEEKALAAKIAEIADQVAFLEGQKEQVTEAEVDSLLRRAQAELMENGFFRKDQRVDAMALLTEVEDELDQSFRDQIFEKLKAGFIKVRTAVADRNN